MAKEKINQIELTNKLKQKFEWVRDWRKNNYDTMALECYKSYLAWTETPKDENGKPINRSHLFIPRVYEQVDTLRSRLVKSFFSSRPYVEFLPMPSQDISAEALAQSEIKAKLAAALLDTQLEKNKIVKKYYDFITSLLIFPAAIMGIGWRYEEKTVKKRLPVKRIDEFGNEVPLIINGRPVLQPKEVTEIIWDDNEIVNVDFFDFWPDPRGRNCDIDTWRFCFQREWLTKDQINEKLEQFRKISSGTVFNLDWDKLDAAARSLEEGRQERQMAIGKIPEISDSWKLEGQETGNNLHEILWHWQPDKLEMLIDEDQVGYTGSNPYWRHGQMPFVVQSFEPLPNEVYGRSMVYWLFDLQEELNTTRNQRIDNVSMCINRGYKVGPGFDRWDELISRPNMIIQEDYAGQVTPLEPMDVTASAYQEESIIKQDMENVVGTPGVVRGATSASGQQTATEVVTQNSNASIRFDIKIQLYEDEVKRIFWLADMNNQQFMTKERLVRVGYDSNSIDSWQMVYPDDTQGEWDYRPTGSNIDPAANKEVRRNQLLQLLDITVKYPQTNSKPAEVFKELLRTFDVRNSQKFQMTPEEVQQQQQIQVQQQMMQQQQIQEQQVQAEQMKQQAEAQKQQQEFGMKIAEKIADKVLTPSAKGGEA